MGDVHLFFNLFSIQVYQFIKSYPFGTFVKAKETNLTVGLCDYNSTIWIKMMSAAFVFTMPLNTKRVLLINMKEIEFYIFITFVEKQMRIAFFLFAETKKSVVWTFMLLPKRRRYG